MKSTRFDATVRSRRSRSLTACPTLLAAAGALFLSGACGGPLSWRSTVEIAGERAVGEQIKTVRFEIQAGTLGIATGDVGKVTWAGGLMRAADTEEGLTRLLAGSADLVTVDDPARPGTLVLRGPTLPPEAQAMIALDLRAVRVPASLAVEVAIAGSGHVMIAHREAPIRVDTARGDLRFEHCHGAIEARTKHGNVIVLDHRGDLVVHSTVGDMQAFVREPGARLELVTGTGTVQCFVPQATEFAVDARAEVGKIGNGFGLPMTRPSTYSAAMVGKQGSGRTKVVLRTADGALSFTPRQFD